MKTLCTSWFSRYSRNHWHVTSFFFKEGMSESQFWTDTLNIYVLLSGSTHILTPKRLLDEVKSLTKPKDMVCIKDE